MKNLRILIADDHALLRSGTRGLLQRRRGFIVVGEAANGKEAVEKAKKLKPKRQNYNNYDFIPLFREVENEKQINRIRGDLFTDVNGQWRWPICEFFGYNKRCSRLRHRRAFPFQLLLD